MRRSGFRAVELTEITTEIAELYGPLIEERGIDFAVDVPDGLTVSGDPFLLAEAVGNLVDNAAKYTPRGGAISVAARHRRRLRTPKSPSPIPAPASMRPRNRRSPLGSIAAALPTGSAASGSALSVVEAVARLHGGALEFSDNAPGLVATLRIATNLPPAPAGASPALAAAG